MKQIPNRIGLRRQYLRKKFANLIGFGAVGPLFILLLFVTLVSGLATLIIFVKWMLHGFPLGEPPRLGKYANAFTENFGFTILVSKLTGMLRRRLINLKRAAHSLAYVPPVTVDTLPADEILVRSSEEPPAARSEVLLRAAAPRETPAEQLLRVSLDDTLSRSPWSVKD